MNKLYCIKFMLQNRYVISVYNTFNAEALKTKIAKNPEFNYILVESNETHDIYEAS